MSFARLLRYLDWTKSPTQTCRNCQHQRLHLLHRYQLLEGKDDRATRSLRTIQSTRLCDMELVFADVQDTVMAARQFYVDHHEGWSNHTTV